MSVAVFITMILATAHYTVRIVTKHLAIPGNGPNSTAVDLLLAEKLRDMGIGSGTKVGIIGDGTGGYWARLGKLRIVAEIMKMGHGTEEFWNSSGKVREQVYEKFRQAHARVIVTACPAYAPTALVGWTRVSGTPFCVRQLE